jgi:PAS domain S-box-containing protein
MREELLKSEARYRALFECVADGIIIASPDNYHLDANASIGRILGYERNELIGLHTSAIVASSEIQNIAPALDELRANSYHHREWQMRRKDNSVFAADVTATVMSDGNIVRMVRDVTERKLANNELLSADRQLRSLVDRLHNAREEEAKRISRELHDDLGQHLTAIKIELDGLESSLSGAAPGHQERFLRMHSGVDHMIEVVQQISGELRLAQLDVLGLSAAIDWQLKEFSQRSATTSRIVRLDETRNLSGAQNTALYRILQESLTNIARHSCATAVEISLEALPDRTVLRIRDDGRGITMTEINDPKSIGLVGMRERARLAGGYFAIHGADGMGTTVLVTIPLSQTGAASN